MCSLSDATELMIRSFLGPCKSNKVVIDNKDFHIVRCPHHLLKEAVTQDPFNFVVEDTLESHHESYGCSTTTLLAMWFFWKEEFQLLLHEGYEVSDIVSYSYDILDTLVSHLHQIALDLETLIFNAPKNETFAKAVCKFPPKREPAACISKKLNYSSRHFSPIVNNKMDESESGEDVLKDIITNDYLKSHIRSIVDSLSHDDEESARLVSELWIQQISSTNEIKFCSEGMIVCPLTSPSSYSSIVEGCIIKSKLLSWYDQETELESKSLIIKGSLTYDFVHLGGNSKVNAMVTKKPDEITISKRDIWLKKCFNLLQKKDVLLGLQIKMWKPTHNSTELENMFIQVHLAASTNSINLYTVILCHPNQSYLNCLEHQFMHLVSRLCLVTKSKKLLPGSGKTEEWCCNLIKRLVIGSGVKAKVSLAIASGFMKYCDHVNKKLEMKVNVTQAYDEMESKVQAWRSALCLVVIALQCDTLLINDPDNVISGNSLFDYL